MQQCPDSMECVFTEDNERTDRTGTGTVGVLGYQMTSDLADGFPLLTTKRPHLRDIIHELLWFLEGNTDLQYPHDSKVSIWDEQVNEAGDLGPIYRVQRRHQLGPRMGQTVDQVQQTLDPMRHQPDGRRTVVSA